MRIGVLTGGGDVPGLNTCIKAIVNHAEEDGSEVLGFRRGWAGPLNVDPDDDTGRQRWVERLTRQSVRTIDRSGGIAPKRRAGGAHRKPSGTRTGASLFPESWGGDSGKPSRAS